MATLAAWTFLNEVPIPQDVAELLVEGEQGVAAFKTMRDSAIFTTKRLIVRDAQGITGKKVEVYSLPSPPSTGGRRRTPARSST